VRAALLKFSWRTVRIWDNFAQIRSVPDNAPRAHHERVDQPLFPYGRRRLSAAHRHEIWRGIRVQLLIEIKRTARMIDEALDRVGECGMLEERDRRALEYLDRSRCSPSISDVGRHLGVSRQTAQRLVGGLRARGYVRVVSYGNRRVVQLRITAPGSAALRMAGGRVLGLLWSITLGMEDRTLETMAAVLRGLQDRIRNPRYEE
jgi:DNA-binding MarR family transcriptional regulator